MSADDGGPGNREVAYRLFAAEFDDADYSYSESDEERAPNYVVSPSGARINRAFVAGVLTEVERVNDDVVRARVADPTGAFVVYAGQYQPDALAFLERADVPSFVAVTGKARTFQPEDADVVYTSLRPESLNAVDADTRDRWVVDTAERTLARIQTFAAALDRPERGDDLREALLADGVDEGLAAGVPRAVEHYGTTGAYLAELRDVALDAARVVAGELEEARELSLAPDAAGDRDAAVDPAGIEVPTAAAGTSTPSATGATAEGESATAGATPDAGETAVDADEETGAVEGATGTPSGAAADESDATADTAETTAEAGAESSADDADVGDELSDFEPVGGTNAGADESEGSVAESVGTESEAGGPGVDEPERSPGEDADAEATGGEAGDEVYELDEEEREAVEEEFGTEFATGEEIPDAGEAGIETPDADDVVDEADEPDAADEGTPSGTAEPDAEADLEDVVVERMRALGDGDGVAREELVAAVSEQRDVAPGAVEDAIQDALMSGRCYESGEDELTPI